MEYIFFSNGAIGVPKGPIHSNKTHLFNKFLEYQFNMCVEPNIPLNNMIFLSALICVIGFICCCALHNLSIFYIVSTLYLVKSIRGYLMFGI